MPSSTVDRAWSPARSIEDSYDGLDWRSPDRPQTQLTDQQRVRTAETSVATDLFTATTEAIEQATDTFDLLPATPNARPAAFRESVPPARRALTSLQSSIVRPSSHSVGELPTLPLPPDPATMRTLAEQRRESPASVHCTTTVSEAVVVGPPVEEPPLSSQEPQLAMLVAMQQSVSPQLATPKTVSPPTRSVLVPRNSLALPETPDLDTEGFPETNESTDTNELTNTNNPPAELPVEMGELSEPSLVAQDNSRRDRATDGAEEIEPSSDAASCQQGTKACRTAWEQLQKSKLTEISLDTTPPFEPGEKDRSVANRKKTEKLSGTESRTWRDRRGQVLAEGQLQDFRFGKVILSTADGAIQEIAHTELSDEDACFLATVWNFPEGCRFGDADFQPRDWHLLTMTWTASAVCHKPLYFEDVSLERYGHTFGPVRQTFLSGAHFFGNVLMLPYNVGLHYPSECQYTLGYYRPGSCAPWLLHALPISTRAIRYQASSILGISAFLP